MVWPPDRAMPDFAPSPGTGTRITSPVFRRALFGFDEPQMLTKTDVIGAAELAARQAGSGVKTVMAAGGLLDRLRAERAANRAAWAQVTSVSAPQ